MKTQNGESGDLCTSSGCFLPTVSSLAIVCPFWTSESSSSWKDYNSVPLEEVYKVKWNKLCGISAKCKVLCKY